MCPPHHQITAVEKLILLQEWIKTPDEAEDIMTADAEAASSAPKQETQQAAAEELRRQYVVVPDATETHRVCPICQEELKYVWHDETDEFVWMDAKQVGNRIYHASCHAEASKDRAGAAAPGSRGGTPESVGVKRKAEVGFSSYPSPCSLSSTDETS